MKNIPKNIPFFITGLPRSRTAWLANLFTTEHTLCFHDIGTIGKTVQDLIEENPCWRVGVSDPILTVMHEELMQRFPTAPWLYVCRPLEASLESFRTWLEENDLPGGSADLEQLFRFHEVAAARLRASDGVHKIAFDDLDSAEAVRAAWEHLLPECEPHGPRFSEKRWRILNGLRIEQLPKGALCQAVG